MEVQKMALVPLELWEEYEGIVHNVRDILECELSKIEHRYTSAIISLSNENARLRSKLRKLKQLKGEQEVLH